MTDTLKSICEQCTQLKNPQLDFIPDELQRCREILLRDLRELIAAATGENEKTVITLAGSILEGILYTLIKSQSDYIEQKEGTFRFDPEGKLRAYVEIFNRSLKDLMPTAVTLPDSVAAYRNLIHINRELNSNLDICATAAREMLLILNTLLEALSEFASAE